MNWFESLKLAADSLWANRLRSFLTMIGLIIGIGSVILVIAFGVGAQQFGQYIYRRPPHAGNATVDHGRC
jgi:MacB-like periplasmic core domain